MRPILAFALLLVACGAPPAAVPGWSRARAITCALDVQRKAPCPVDATTCDEAAEVCRSRITDPGVLTLYDSLNECTREACRQWNGPGWVATFNFSTDDAKRCAADALRDCQQTP